MQAQIHITKDIYDKALLLLMYLQLTILSFLGYRRTLVKIIVALIILRFLLKGINKKAYKFLFALASILGLFVLSGLASAIFSFSNFRSNGLMLLYPMVYVFYISYLCRFEPDTIDSLMEHGFILFNMTMVINIVVMIIQIKFPYSINAVSVSNVISYYPDLISGFFEYASTHTVTLFTGFIFLYDLNWIAQQNKLLYKIYTIIYLIMIAIITAYISMHNDNKALFLVLPVMLLMYIFLTNSRYKLLIRVLLILCIVPVIMLLAYYISPTVREVIDQNLGRVVSLISRSSSLGDQAHGSGERIAMIKYAFQQPTTWLLGDGFAIAGIREEGYRGFRHFGQADFSTLLIMGGIWYTMALYIFYIKSFFNVIGTDKMSRTYRVWQILLITVFTVFITIYMQCFTNTNEMIALLLVMLAFRCKECGAR